MPPRLNQCWTHVEKATLKKKSRDDLNTRLLCHVTGYKGDIICLQEVDKSIFEEDYLPFFEQAGYDCVLNCKVGTIREGLVCFVYKERFR